MGHPVSNGKLIPQKLGTEPRGEVFVSGVAPYPSPVPFFPSTITLLNIRLIRVWNPDLWT